MLHICFCTNDRWSYFAMKAIYDIIIRKNPETEITFYVLRESTQRSFDAFNKIDGIKVITKDIDVKKEFGYAPIYSVPWLGPFKHMKFLIPDLDVFENVNRCLYLDVDMLARKDLTDLCNVDLNKKAIGYVRNFMNLGRSNFSDLLNDPCALPYDTGIAVMDLNECRKIELVKECKKWALRKCIGDEYLIRDVCSKYAHPIDPKYQVPFHFVKKDAVFNDISKWNTYNNTNYKSIDELVSESYLWHFCGDKDLYYNNIYYRGHEFVKTVFDLSTQRLEEFLETGKVMEWKPEDDLIFTSM